MVARNEGTPQPKIDMEGELSLSDDLNLDSSLNAFYTRQTRLTAFGSYISKSLIVRQCFLKIMNFERCFIISGHH